MSKEKKPLLPFTGDASIPAYLKAQKRWAPWKAQWNVPRGKWDKIPVRADRPEFGLSTANAARWFSYADAHRAHLQAQGMTAGVGYCMTGYHGIVGVDMDGCVTDGVVDEWAAEAIADLGCYAEFSPSGNGIRLFGFGRIEHDWNNHQVGIEVYQGDKPRFLTATGRHLPGTPADVVDVRVGSLERLAEKYRVNATQKKGEAGALPDTPAKAQLPDVRTLGLPERALQFLLDGDTGDVPDRSRVLHSTAVALASAGLPPPVVLGVLCDNPYAFEVAMDHRRQDEDRAAVYLWEHHAAPAGQKALSKMLTDADFEAIAAEAVLENEAQDAAQGVAVGGEPVGEGDVMAMFDSLDPVSTTPKPEKPQRFAFVQAQKYAQRGRRLNWIIKDVLPKAELGAVFGESGSGKTFFLLDMLARVAGGLNWFGTPVKRKYRVAYVAAEGALGVQDRLQALTIAHGIDLGSLDLFVLGDQPNMLDKEDVKLLTRQLVRLGKLDLIVLDTLSQVTPGANENSSDDMGKALSHFKGLHRVTGAMVLLVGHSGKDASRGQRGWSGLKGAMDVQIEVTKTATYRAATITKLKDGKGEGAEFMFELVNVDIDYDIEDDEMITSAVVEPIISADKKKAMQEAAAARTKPGRKAGNSPYYGGLVRALERLCGYQNKPVQRAQLEAEAVAVITEELEAEGKPVPSGLKGTIQKLIVRSAEHAKDMLMDQDTELFTLKVPPRPPTGDD